MKNKIYLASIYISLQLLATLVSSLIWYGFDESLPIFGWVFIIIVHLSAFTASTAIADDEGLI